MIHLGDITKISGYEVPNDVVEAEFTEVDTETGEVKED